MEEEILSDRCKRSHSVGLGKFQWALLFYAGLAWLSDAMEMMIISLLGPAVSSPALKLPINQSFSLTEFSQFTVCL